MDELQTMYFLLAGKYEAVDMLIQVKPLVSHSMAAQVLSDALCHIVGVGIALPGKFASDPEVA